MFIELFALFGLLISVFYKLTTKPPSMPPGTFGLPIIGQLPPMNASITEYLGQLKQRYGSIFTTKWGSRVVVILADPHIIKKAFNHPDIQDRPNMYSFQIFYKFQNVGIVMSNDSVWRDNRRFLLHNLRNLGMGKTRLEDSIIDEANMLVRYLEKTCLDGPTEIDWSINVAVLNVIWQMLASKRYEPDDEKIIQYNIMARQNTDIIQGPIFLVDMMPWLLSVIPKSLLDKWTNLPTLIKNRDEFNVQCLETIMEHEETLDPENPRDIIDHYLLEIESHKDNTNSHYKDDYFDLLAVMSDMFVASSETTSTTLRWIILYMALNKKVQNKAHEVLDAIVPKHRLPSLEDRAELVYIDALVLDVLRLSSLALMGLAHSTTEDVQLEGYTIPKNTMLMPCLELCHKDSAFWEKPYELYPEHFIDADGKLDSKKDAFVPFSVGRRQCLGESLARMELFLFASAILHRFTIEPPPGVELDIKTDPSQKLLNHPKPFRVVLKKIT